VRRLLADVGVEAGVFRVQGDDRIGIVAAPRVGVALE
jgi:hypothetical protein